MYHGRRSNVFMLFASVMSSSKMCILELASTILRDKIDHTADLHSNTCPANVHWSTHNLFRRASFERKCRPQSIMWTTRLAVLDIPFFHWFPSTKEEQWCLGGSDKPSIWERYHHQLWSKAALFDLSFAFHDS